MKRDPTLPARFWSKVRKTRTCWPWTGARHRFGYGEIQAYGSPRDAHRVRWIMSGRRIPARHQVCHKCDVPACVRLSHLFTGTHRQNHADSHKKLRHQHGERHAWSKLTAAGAREIRRLYRGGGWTHQHLADRYRVTDNAVFQVLHRLTWKEA